MQRCRADDHRPSWEASLRRIRIFRRPDAIRWLPDPVRRSPAQRGPPTIPRRRRQALREGSVRKAADRVRVTVQLIDGDTETHIWAERYDRKLEDIFAIQDEVTSSIA